MTTGASDGDYTAITEGNIKEGDRVIIDSSNTQKTTAKTVEQAAVSEIKQSDLKQQTVDQEILDKAIQNAANQKDVSTLNIQQ